MAEITKLVLRVIEVYPWLNIHKDVLHKCQQPIYTKADLISLLNHIDDATPKLYHPFLIHEGLRPKDIKVCCNIPGNYFQLNVSSLGYVASYNCLGERLLEVDLPSIL